MDLTCAEQIEVMIHAEKDFRILKDPRVLATMYNQERRFTPQCNYFLEVQTEIQPFMRQVVTTWMHEVCEEQMCEDQVFPLAVNCMDRFLCLCPIKRQQLQLLGAVCLLIASKLRSTNSFPIEILCAYTDYSVSHANMVAWELLVLSKLKWNVASITGFDYIDQIIEMFPWGSESNLLHRHARTLVSISYTDSKLIRTPPSLIAAACLTSAIRGLRLRSTNQAVNDICRIAAVSPASLDTYVRIVDEAVERSVPRSPPSSPEPKIQGYESPQHGPNTPTEVENIYF
ncbi:G1/S-specific cyclin-D2-like [Coccinella septempunctata]|uniref:G1/S-specific cyclin-D2-like n=1 Tax=Coccinella septempunctata TaxID=41139 RepID=UPI001D0836E2|nr:G1/S-specific cyclin-D2-like [Coccinella septempunctata]